ncbi:uncharacterized protein LOC116429246 [Nomia melanderi]|uniref:uncharacterized protein LOC116429246 n=1 Tax=Nomia melanderi TaxID=2448451 RepID=UPI00130414B5|nr:uncharacterized protein LOC116429246 [Nomia melanderi]XP_031837849.1 uncharacterized protein LOC116429246 [Nomia melanderi]XP_031837850.1 uncharacterized protein LOC116429246 [Nomia melanderi]XP_031837851.1 uncharacterized protein LOC116429246 [Nomia melanderi]
MRSISILILCATGISAFVAQPYNASINLQVTNHLGIGQQNAPTNRFACPIGFFRLKRYCYYLSAGTAPWRDAYFHCKDRNATLAILDRNGKDRMLRKYLMGDQFTKLERWIGGIFNWQKSAWQWGVTGEEMVFQNFGRPQTNQSKQQYAWHCITIDPTLKYKWSPRSCIERKHFVCEVLAGRIPRRRKKNPDPYAPQNQRLKPGKKGKKYPKEMRKSQKGRQNRQQQRRRRYWEVQNGNDDWSHGVKIGARPPSNNRVRHHPNRTQVAYSAAKKPQYPLQGLEYGAFLGDGPSNDPQSLTHISRVLSPNTINGLASEEVLRKP